MGIRETLGKELRFPRRRRGATWKGPGYLSLIRHRADLLTVTRQIASIVSANAPMVTGLEMAAIDAPNSKVEVMLLLLRDDIASGLSLSASMGKRPRFFPAFYTSLVGAGETTGTLSECLGTLSEELLEVISVSRSLIQDLFLIGIILVFLAFLTTFSVARVFPVFVEILNDFGVPPTPLAAFWIEVLIWVRNHWPTLLVLILLMGICFLLVRRALRSRSFARRKVASYLFRIPVVGEMVVKSNLSTVSSILERLLTSGVPLDQSLDEVSKSNLNPAYEQGFAYAAEKVREGTSVSEALKTAPAGYYPPSFTAMIALGEGMGNLPAVLGRLGGLYRKDALAMRKIVSDLFLPAAVLCLASLVLFTTAALFESLVGIVDALLADL